MYPHKYPPMSLYPRLYPPQETSAIRKTVSLHSTAALRAYKQGFGSFPPLSIIKVHPSFCIIYLISIEHAMAEHATATTMDKLPLHLQ